MCILLFYQDLLGDVVTFYNFDFSFVSVHAFRIKKWSLKKVHFPKFRSKIQTQHPGNRNLQPIELRFICHVTIPEAIGAMAANINVSTAVSDVALLLLSFYQRLSYRRRRQIHKESKGEALTSRYKSVSITTVFWTWGSSTSDEAPDASQTPIHSKV